MIFEYDEKKSLLNKSKHGIDFEHAKELWNDPFAFELSSPQSEDEDRFLVLGQIDSKNYTAIITYRDTSIRIISVRRSRDKEKKLYENIRAR
jgi:uncharacterized DUF497 family protein